MRLATSAMGMTLALLLLSGTVDAASAHWSYVGASDDGSFVIYIDKERIKKKGQFRTVWQLRDTSQPEIEPGGTTPYFSFVTLQRVNCASDTMQMLDWVLYSDHLGKGNVVSAQADSSIEESPLQIAPESVAETVEKLVCK